MFRIGNDIRLPQPTGGRRHPEARGISRGSIIGILLLISLLSCNVGTNKLESRTEVFHQKACHGEYCAEVNLKYPVFLGERERSIVLNNLIEEKIIKTVNVYEEIKVTEIIDAATNFLDSYVEFMDDFESAQDWEINLDAKVTFENEKIISIVFETYSFTGGAHPNSFRKYLNFDKQKNTEIDNISLIIDEQILLEIAESKFKEIHQVENDIPLKKTEMFFLDENDKFFLPTAIGFESDSLVLFYNSYEIGPYVMGTTEIKFAKSEMKGIVNLYK
ncbi:DUF3298 and DUF4163 domain-containing protein [Aquiflexum sp.]|uniref:DUF3298 and DUF4163 domain-containing protein n=1 Tax=Aquiflexum sp. TaxID=1872584 RepID=UPI003593640D